MSIDAADLLGTLLRHELHALQQQLSHYQPGPQLRETGTLLEVGNGVARVSGLAGVEAMELLYFADSTPGLAFNLDEHEVGVVLLGESDTLCAGARVERSGRVLDVPVGNALLGRVVNALGQPLDAGPTLDARERWPVERPAAFGEHPGSDAACHLHALGTTCCGSDGSLGMPREFRRQE